MALVSRKDRTKFRNQVLKPLLEGGWLQMTIPDKPTSSKQKYRLTDKGQQLLAELGEDDDDGVWNETLVERKVTYHIALDGRLFLIENVPARVNVETGEKTLLIWFERDLWRSGDPLGSAAENERCQTAVGQTA